MKLKKINHIQRFGIYQNFSWEAGTPEFSLFNVFYGWNYSGKTTLSRVFRCFEIGKIHTDYNTCNFEFEDTDGNKCLPSLFPSTLPIRVFNADFINENLKWNQDLEPILLLGQQNITLQAELETHKNSLATLNQEIQTLNQQKSEKINSLSTALTNRARELKFEYSIPVFDKRHFEPLVEAAYRQTDRTSLLSQEIAKLTSTCLSTDKKNPIDVITIEHLDISALLAEVNELIQQTVKSNVIERLKNDIALNAWVKDGHALHTGKDVCEFCGGTLPHDLLESLSNHFSEDYDNLIDNLTNKTQQFEHKKITTLLPDSANFYSELQQSYVEKKRLVEEAVRTINLSISELISTLEVKKLKAFEAMSEVDLRNNPHDITKLLQEINSIISTHNLKTSEFDQQKEAAYNKLIANFALEFVIAQNYGQTLTDIETLNQTIASKRGGIPQITTAISTIEQQLSETVKGADTTNSYLKRYFGKDDIQISVTSDNKFQLLRNSIVAKNLSEGEKTAIAFAYFMTRLHDKNTNFSDTLVYIDDPISSLDSNHLFNTYSFIKDHFYEYDAVTKQHKCKCAQFFISTHNYEFFNLIKDWFSKMKKIDTSYYLVSRVTNSTSDFAVLRPLNNHLFKFKSEYSYLFSVINGFKQNPVADFDQLYNLPNILRRFIESFTAFKYLSTRNIEENIEQLITNPVDCERVRKFVHYHTHSLSTTKLEQFSDLTECISVIEIVTNSLNNIDPIHYAALLAENVPPVIAGP